MVSRRFSGISSKALAAFSTAAYCYSLPTNVEIKSEADVRKYAIRFSFATHVANRVYDPKLKEEYKWIQHSKYLDSIFKVMDEAIDVALNKGEGNDKIEFHDGVAMFKNTDPKTYTNANKNAVLLYSWIYMNLNNGKTSIDDAANKLKDKYKDVDFKKAVSDVKGYDKALHITNWLKLMQLDAMKDFCWLSRHEFEKTTKIRIMGGEDNENGYMLYVPNIFTINDKLVVINENEQVKYVGIAIKGQADISNVEIFEEVEKIVEKDGKNNKIYDGTAVYSAKYDEYMKIREDKTEIRREYDIEKLTDETSLTCVYSFDEGYADLNEVNVSDVLKGKNIQINLHCFYKDRKEVRLNCGFLINKLCSVKIHEAIIQGKLRKLRTSPDDEGWFYFGNENLTDNNITAIDFYGIDNAEIKKLNLMLAKHKYLKTATNVDKITQDVYELEEMFNECEALEYCTPINKMIKIKSSTASDGKNRKLKMTKMFMDCKALKKIDMSLIDYLGYKSMNMQNMCEGCSSLEYVNMSFSKLESYVSFADIFIGCDIKELNVTNTTVKTHDGETNIDTSFIEYGTDKDGNKVQLVRKVIQ